MAPGGITDQRKILHIDMDAFYAAIEQRDHPAYRGRPVVVGGRPEQRGAVAAASYEARRYGIHSAMPARTAVQRCSHLIFAKPRFEVYRGVSAQIREIFKTYTPLVEPLALDEAYLDVTGCESATAIAAAIKKDILAATGLTASAGVSINKFLAKMASGQNKPDGLYVILPQEAMAFIAGLPIEAFHGVGPATARRMAQLGIATGADLQAWSEADLVAAFGKVGRHYFRVAQACDSRPVNPHRIRKSVGAERSFAEDRVGLAALEPELAKLVEILVTRLDQAQKRGYTLTLKLKYASYRQITRSRTVERPLYEPEAIARLGQELLISHLEPEPVRLLGLALSNLVALDGPTYEQLALPV